MIFVRPLHYNKIKERSEMKVTGDFVKNLKVIGEMNLNVNNQVSE